MKQKAMDWMIHLVANGVTCACCGKEVTGFPPHLCNAHTHGMEKYNHPDFQLVVRYENNVIGYILNSLGCRVQNGECFSAGMLVSDIFEDCQVRLDEFEESGRKVLRVIVPDKNNRFPEDKDCAEPHRYQTLPTELLSISLHEVQ